MRGTTNTESVADGVLLEAVTELEYRQLRYDGFKMTRSDAGHWDGQRFIHDDEVDWDDLPTGRGQA